ncbi:hypothetical protein EK21DRAFT_118374 [Setomelanomma holmii]|uniref:Uncharacterized protein n=1 Tax=Setomelanomma holmii TaxID=210430 RepID=A0A9P4GYH6_9PLEO|nr:hypothetical protein EK21DRAFT_118374 [Setomelanomma holmii]
MKYSLLIIALVTLAVARLEELLDKRDLSNDFDDDNPIIIIATPDPSHIGISHIYTAPSGYTPPPPPPPPPPSSSPCSQLTITYMSTVTETIPVVFNPPKPSTLMPSILPPSPTAPIVPSTSAAPVLPPSPKPPIVPSTSTSTSTAPISPPCSTAPVVPSSSAAPIAPPLPRISVKPPYPITSLSPSGTTAPSGTISYRTTPPEFTNVAGVVKAQVGVGVVLGVAALLL